MQEVVVPVAVLRVLHYPHRHRLRLRVLFILEEISVVLLLVVIVSQHREEEEEPGGQVAIAHRFPRIPVARVVMLISVTLLEQVYIMQGVEGVWVRQFLAGGVAGSVEKEVALPVV